MTYIAARKLMSVVLLMPVLASVGSAAQRGILSINLDNGVYEIRNAKTGELISRHPVRVAPGSPPKTAANYQFQTIPTPAGATASYALAISGSQITAGYSDKFPESDAYGLLFQGSNFQVLNYPAATYTNLTGINAEGAIVGDYNPDPNGQNASDGLIYRGLEFTSVSAPGSTFTVLSGISDTGAIVGSYLPDGQFELVGFLRNKGVETVLDFAGAIYTTPTGVNQSGEVVGVYAVGQVGVSGFTYLNGTFTTIQVPGSTMTFLQAINNNGQMAGTYYDSANNVHGFVFENGQFTTVDFPRATTTQIFGISNTGRIVGEYVGPNCPLVSQNCGFLATPNRTWTNHQKDSASADL